MFHNRGRDKHHAAPWNVVAIAVCRRFLGKKTEASLTSCLKVADGVPCVRAAWRGAEVPGAQKPESVSSVDDFVWHQHGRPRVEGGA